MSQWEHLPCGTVFEAKVPPLDCDFCQSLLVIGGARHKRKGWRRVGTSPTNETSKQRRKRKRRNKIAASRREAIYERDGHRCVRCGERPRRRELTLDHIVPLSKGGTNANDNLQTMCKACNNAKGDTLPEAPTVVSLSAP